MRNHISQTAYWGNISVAVNIMRSHTLRRRLTLLWHFISALFPFFDFSLFELILYHIIIYFSTIIYGNIWYI